MKTVLAILLTVSFVFNVSALVLPFMNVEMVLRPDKPYSLLRSVQLMWEMGLPVLAVIVLFFSVLFPFAKLGLLAYLALWGTSSDRNRKRLLRVEALGKWSMIDVFIVCFILALTNNQIFINAVPRVGLYAFMTAIILSMVSGALLAHAWGGHLPLAGSRPENRIPRRLAVVLLLATLAWLSLMLVPFVVIDDWLLIDRAFTLLTFLWALALQGAPVVAAVLCATLVAVPAAELALTWRLWWRLRQPHSIPPWAMRIRQFRHWSMLDVFLAALIIFLMEGQHLMTLKPGWGVASLGAILAADLALLSVRQRLHQRM